MGDMEQASRDFLADIKGFNERLVADFRANGGQITTGPLAGAPVVILTVTGAKTARALITPLVYSEDGGRMVVIASKAGSDTNPAWYHNLKANPLAQLEIGTESYEIQATEVYGAERDRLFDAQAALMTIFKAYAAKTERVIPVFVLDRT